MDSDDDTFDDYSIEFDDEPAKNDVSKEKSESPCVESKIRSSVKDKTKNGKVGKNKGYTTGRSCRICLKRCKKQSRDASEFAETYLKCTGFSFENGQGPTKICYPCMNELLKVENFIEKCSETEDKLSKGMVPKDGESDHDDDISDISDVDVVIEGEDCESSGSNFSDKIVKKKKRGKKRLDKPKLKDVPKLPKKENRGRPPLDPSKRKPILSKGPRGRPRGSNKPKDGADKIFRPPGRPKNSFKVKLEQENGEDGVKREDGTTQASESDRQICFMCGKLVRAKQISYHLWKHRKDEEMGATPRPDAAPPTCEYCHKVYKSADVLKNHMKRIHPGVVYGMPAVRDDSPDPKTMDDNFDKEFHVPPKDEYPQIQSPYNHVQALHYLQKNVRR